MEFLRGAMPVAGSETDDENTQFQSTWASNDAEFHHIQLREQGRVECQVFTGYTIPDISNFFRIKERYLLMRRIENDLIETGYCIFGGYVRDLILHHHGAKNFYENVGTAEGRYAYTDSSIHPESFADRNTYPMDIDCFLSSHSHIANIRDILTKIKMVEVKEEKELTCYAHHPLFSTYYGCKRITIEYTYNHSLQRKGEKIDIDLDLVFSKGELKSGPWNLLIDAACNMLYMDKTGIHFAYENSNDPIENYYRLSSVISLIQKKKTFIPPMSYQFRIPKQNEEVAHIITSRNCSELEASATLSKYSKFFRILYRAKYLQRMAKLVRTGWKITNLDIKFTTSTDNINDETQCAISHDDLIDGALLVQLGTKNQDGVWKQTSVLNWHSLVRYIFTPLTRLDDAFAHRFHWQIQCPISKHEVDVTENRALGVVLKEALVS